MIKIDLAYCNVQSNNTMCTVDDSLIVEHWIDGRVTVTDLSRGTHVIEHFPGKVLHHTDCVAFKRYFDRQREQDTETLKWVRSYLND